MATRKQILKQKLVESGFLPYEAQVMASSYTITDFRSNPYLQNILKARRLYITNLSKRRGYADELIKQYIKDRYILNDWIKDGKMDVWAMVRYYRGKAIEDGEYFPKKRKGSHHGKGISKGDVKAQKKRASKVTNAQKIDNLNAQISITDDAETKKWLIGLRDNLK